MKTWNFSLIIACAILLMVSLVTAEDTSDEESLPVFDWNGNWQTNTDTLTLVQTGNEVTGTYAPLDWNSTNEPGVIDGMVSEEGKILTGTWQEGGNVTLTLAEDGSLFNGTYTYENRDDYSDYWNGTRIITEEFANESGWNGTFESNWYSMVFTQDGNVITVIYEPLTEFIDSGSIVGTVSEDGKVLTGTWIEEGGFEFTQSDDGTSFNGTYGFGDNINGGDDFTWNGIRI